ncbi:MAG TPA: ribosome silencing factor [Lacunisphaera sp.]|nr:ribosome silencing factor [Lacunisphaera sp.]
MNAAPDSLSLVKLCCAVLADKKAGDLRVLDISEQSSITDYLIVATVTSEPHLRALRIELEKALDGAQAHIVGIETAQESGWTVVDAFDVMIHLFTTENREKYRLESLWKDAKEMSVNELLALPKPKAKPAKSAKTPKKRAVAAPKKKASSPRKKKK